MIHRLLPIACVLAFSQSGIASAADRISYGDPAGATACFALSRACEAAPIAGAEVRYLSSRQPDSPRPWNLAQAGTGGGEAASVPGTRHDAAGGGFWAEVWDYLYNGASITLGIGTRQSELAVTRKSDGAYGKIAQRNTAAYFLSYSTRESFIGTTHVGYTVMLNYSTFDMDRQEVDKQYVDLGTRVRGRVAYVVPTLFYQWGEHRSDGRFLRAGAGLGAGVAKYDGTVILNAPTNTTPTAISNGAYKLKLATSVFLEARYRYWGIKVSFAGPSYEDDTYKYSVSDIAINLGYSYYF